MEYKLLGSLVKRKIGYGIVQPGQSVENGVPVIKVNNIINGLTSVNDLDTTTQAISNKYSRTLLHGGELIISVVGTIGKTAIVPESFAGCNLVRAVALIDIEDELVSRWVKYYLDSPYGKDYIHQNLNTTVQPTLNIKLLADMPIPFYGRDYINKVVSVLSAIDSKIALNNKINDNLEQQAWNVFIDWFVLFSPFANEEFVTSPIGTKIPATLKMVQIANIPHLLETGKRPKGGAASDGIPSVGAENVKQLGKFDFSSNKFIPVEFAKKQKTGKISGYELLLYKDGGRPGTFIPHFSMFGEGFPYKEFFINEHVFKLDFFDHGKNEFAYFYMQTDYAMSWLANNGGKAAIPGINKQNVQDIWIYDMEHPKVKQFCSLVQPFFKAIFRNCNENVRLANLRDTLLPKLMSGEIELDKI